MTLEAVVALLLAPRPAALPPVSDLLRFPHPSVVQAELDANTAFQALLEHWIAYYPQHYWMLREIHAETEQCRQVWLALQDAQRYGSEVYCRKALGTLRGLLGEELYHAGQMVPGVPIWRLRLP